MYKISLEFNGTTSKDMVFVCATKREASKWMADYSWSAPKGHVFIVHRVTGEDVVQVDVSERYHDALRYAPNRNAWQDQRGRVAKDRSVYIPQAENRR